MNQNLGTVQIVDVSFTTDGSTIAVDDQLLSSTQIAATSFLSGPTGWSAYQLAQSQGFNGTLTDYLASLKGQKGDTGTGTPGVGVPTGGSTGQVLAKTANSDYATAWVTPTGQGNGTALNLYSPDGTLWTMSIDNGGHTIWTPSVAPVTAGTFGTTFGNFRFTQ